MTDDRLLGVQTTWEQLAQIDPLWAVLSEPGKQGRGWDVGEFLATGEAEISSLIDDLAGFGFDTFGAALDFGCGVGRLTQPLSRRFERAVGVDIAPTMVETARRLAVDETGIEFVVNSNPDLSIFGSGSFDLVYSNIVLQHMPPELARVYLGEFFRVVRPGGFVVFQIPSHLTDEWLPNGNDGTVLTEGQHRAELVVADAPRTMIRGRTAPVRARVRNASGSEWQQDLTHQINLANRWRDAEGEMVVADDGRERIPGRVRNGQEFQLDLLVRAPDSAGSYVLELDLVQEGVTWFADQGSSTVCTAIEVVEPVSSDGQVHGGELPATEGETGAKYPTFMMRGIERAGVERLVGEFGGEVLELREHVTEWVSYRYVTRRR